MVKARKHTRSTIILLHKRGIAIPTALVLISFLFIFVIAMMNYSSQEMTNVKQFYELKRAEYLAYSGLNWAEVNLQNKRWWVNNRFDPAKKISRASGGATVHEFFGSGNGKTFVIAEEFASAKPSPMPGYSQVQRLDHIRVYSIGEFNGQKVLVYGKFIMSPEPFLNSDSTEGAETETTEVAKDNKVLIVVPQPWSQDGPVPDLLIVKNINAAVGDKVDPNTILATLGAHPDDPIQISMTWEIKAPAIGTLTKVNFKLGQSVKGKEIFGECTDDMMMATRSNKTLKKLVRVTKIIDRDITNMDLSDFETRRKNLDAHLKKLSDDYVINYAKNQPHIVALENAFVTPSLGPVVTKDQILERLSTIPGESKTPLHEAGNKFLESMIEKWIMPGLSASQRKVFPGNSEFHLAIAKCQPRQEVLEVLSQFGRLAEITTGPQRNPELYKLGSTESYKKLMNFDAVNKSTDDFVHDVTFLPDAAKKVQIIFNKGTPWDESTFKDLAKSGDINPADYWWWPSKAGWYTKPDIIIESVEIPYNFVNNSSGKPFVMEMGFVLNYLRKHYDEGMAVPPGSSIRLPGDQQDIPQRPPLPDSTGAKYSGLSS